MVVGWLTVWEEDLPPEGATNISALRPASGLKPESERLKRRSAPCSARIPPVGLGTRHAQDACVAYPVSDIVPWRDGWRARA